MDNINNINNMGTPNGMGMSNNMGMPNNMGVPNNAGMPNNMGMPNNAGMPAMNNGFTNGGFRKGFLYKILVGVTFGAFLIGALSAIISFFIDDTSLISTLFGSSSGFSWFTFAWQLFVFGLAALIFINLYEENKCLATRIVCIAAVAIGVLIIILNLASTGIYASLQNSYSSYYGIGSYGGYDYTDMMGKYNTIQTIQKFVYALYVFGLGAFVTMIEMRNRPKNQISKVCHFATYALTGLSALLLMLLIFMTSSGDSTVLARSAAACIVLLMTCFGASRALNIILDKKSYSGPVVPGGMQNNMMGQAMGNNGGNMMGQTMGNGGGNMMNQMAGNSGNFGPTGNNGGNFGLTN